MSSAAEDMVQPKAKKRKLRYLRTSNACIFCRKRKVRCSGTFPCEVCVREEVTCEYANGAPPNQNRKPPPRSAPSVTSPSASFPPKSYYSGSESGIQESPFDAVKSSPTVNNIIYEAAAARRGSAYNPKIFAQGHSHVDANAGISFLYQSWDKSQDQELKGEVGVDDSFSASQTPLVSYGDIPRFDVSMLQSLPPPNMAITEMSNLIEKYFRYVSPTYHYMHSPSVMKWAESLASRGQQLTPARKACVLLVCAQVLMHSGATPGEPREGSGDSRLSISCAERARAYLENETGPPSLESTQARLALCFYLLSTFRLNECRYSFSFAVTVATSMGLHRRHSSARCSALESESKRRTFWTMYILDGYLGVMLGRPRLLHDDDIDQPYPDNIDDTDLDSGVQIEDMPKHGDLEAMKCHIQLARLMTRSNIELYPIRPLTNDQLLERSTKMLKALDDWQDALPDFLKPRPKTLTGSRTFERQNTILKIAGAHVRILAARRIILTDFSQGRAPTSTPTSTTSPNEYNAHQAIAECIAAVISILDAIEALIPHNKVRGPFWSLQYNAIVALSTFYVFIIQGVRHTLPQPIDSYTNVEERLAQARRCQSHLANIPPPGSQAEQHHKLLAHLRSKADRELHKFRTSQPSSRQTSGDDAHPQRLGPAPAFAPRSVSALMANSKLIPTNSLASFSTTAQPLLDGFATTNTDLEPSTLITQFEPSSDVTTLANMLTPTNSESSLGHMLDYGWESLDTMGTSSFGGSAGGEGYFGGGGWA